MVECPKCSREFKKTGLHGHLKWVHDLQGEELESAYREAISEQQAEQEPEAAASAEEQNREDREARPVPGSHGNQRAPQREEREPVEQRYAHGDRSERKPLREAVDELRRARERRRAVEDAMETKTESGGLFKRNRQTIPANETWAELLEEAEEAEADALDHLKRQVEHYEVDRSV